jgi:uncharacterized protein YecT (DUF1311 family)
MSSRLTVNRRSFRTPAYRHWLILLCATASVASSVVSALDEPKENSQNSGAPDVSYPLDDFLDRCLARKGHGSTASQVDCTDRARQRWNSELNRDYQRLADRLAPKTKTLLEDAQRRWLQYLEADRLLIDAVYELTKGTMYAPMQAYSHLRPIRERSLVLKSYFTVLTNPKVSKDLPRAGKQVEGPDNSGNSEVDYPTDDSLSQCIDQHPGPSERTSCVEAALNGWDEAMNTVYRKLTDRLAAKSTLVEAQRAWLAFRDAEYPLIDSIYETLPSPEYRSLQAYSRLRLTRERTLLLKKYFALTSTKEAN